MTERLSTAKKRLEEGQYTCILLDGDKEYPSTQSGIRPLLTWIGEGIDVQGYTAADVVVGKAAALLYCKMGVAEVYAGVISEPAKEVLEAHGISCAYGECVPYIINRKGDGMCPMEKTVWEISDPEEAVPALTAKIKELQAGK